MAFEGKYPQGVFDKDKMEIYIVVYFFRRKK